jgi:ribonuclease HI
MNTLFGVLTRFRSEKLAFVADLEAMFYQVKVPPADRSFLRFLWWPKGDISKDVVEFQMTVHIFGAVSSPSIANFVVRKIGSAASTQVMNTLHHNFYMDDCLKSTQTAPEAKQLIADMCNIFHASGFHLTKFFTNSPELLTNIPMQDRASDLQKETSMLRLEDFPSTRTLGVVWNPSSDVFSFKVTLREFPETRRGILAMTASMFDPLGMVGPVVLRAKKILQDICREKDSGWDDPLSLALAEEWRLWLRSLGDLDGIQIRRCFKGDSDDVTQELHVFSDASSFGYGAVVYLRSKGAGDSQDTLSFVVGKSRLAPMKAMTIPRLELAAAALAVKLAQLVKKEMQQNLEVTFYTDSTIVLHSIKNETKRFPVYVANRLSLIHEYSEPYQWHHVPSQLNPADDASRGLMPQKLSSSSWLRGPSFLLDGNVDCLDKEALSPEDEQEILILATAVAPESTLDPLHKFFLCFSDWQKLKRIAAIILRMQKLLLSKLHNEHVPSLGEELDANDLVKAEKAILRWLQASVYADEISDLQRAVKEGKQPKVKKSSSLYRLDPFLHEGLLCIGGRLSETNWDFEAKHPIIIPRSHLITQLIIRDVHVKLGHAGRNHVLSDLRSRYWVIAGNAAVRSVITACVKCRRFRSPVQEQKMADLPPCRLDASLPPFSFVGVDYFGPFLVREGRKDLKRYGVVFTCLVSRAIHLEVAKSLETDAFINALRRFTSRRGNIMELWSDNGTNFVGASNDLKQALREMDPVAVGQWATKQAFIWHFNPPSGSHMGGVWERTIRTIRKVLNGLFTERLPRLSDDELHTLMCEVESIVNSRPLTTVSSDPHDTEPLSPAHLLMLKPLFTMPPPGVFQQPDLYSRKRWRRIQYLADLFWTRWKKEFLALLQERSKWRVPRRDIKVGDVVLLKEESPRNAWPLALVESTKNGRDGRVREACVRLGKSNATLCRPITKMILLVENDD